MPASLVSASVIVCETVLWEKTDIPSAIRVMNFLGVGPKSSVARFFAITSLCCNPGDFEPHRLQVQMRGLSTTSEAWIPLASSPEHRFVYGYKIDPAGFGGFILSTEFNIDLASLEGLGMFWVQVWLDGEKVAQTSITLLRPHY